MLSMTRVYIRKYAATYATEDGRMLGTLKWVHRNRVGYYCYDKRVYEIAEKRGNSYVYTTNLLTSHTW